MCVLDRTIQNTISLSQLGAKENIRAYSKERQAQWKTAIRGLKNLLVKEKAKRKKSKKLAKECLVSSSRILAYKEERKKKGCHWKPEDEIHVVESLLDYGNLIKTENSWLNRRKKILLERIHNPTLRYKLFGPKFGRLSTEEQEQLDDEQQRLDNLDKEIFGG